MTKVKKVSEKEAIEVLNGIEGSPFLNITQRTYPTLNKKDRVTSLPANFDKGEISKVSTLTVKVGSEYITRVLNQLARENKDSADYKAGKNTNPIVKIAKNGILGVSEKNEKMMFEYGTLKNTLPTVKYLANGTEITKSAIGDILPVSYKPTNQGTDVQIGIRKVYFSNIMDFTFNKVMYQIIR